MLTFVKMYRNIFYLLLIFIILCVPIARAQEETNDDGARINELYNQAEMAQEKGELDKAIKLYQEVIKLAPDLFEPKYQCAVAYLATNKPDFTHLAVQLLKEVVTLKPDFARGHASLGSALARIDEPIEAETALRRALELNNALPVRPLLAELLINRGAYKEAEEELKVLVAAGRADWQNYLLLGIAQQANGQDDAALASYSRALELHAGDGEIYYRRGKLQNQKKNYREAINDLKLAFQISRQNSDIGLALAQCYADSGDNQAAIDLCQALVEKATPDLRAAFTELLARLGANSAAIAQLEKLLIAEPKNVRYLTRLGDLYLSLSPAKSAEYWQQAVMVEPTADNLVGLASALLKAQRFEEAIHHFNVVLEHNNNYYEAHAGLGLALFKLERFAQAAEQFLWVTRARPENEINCYFLAICFDRLGDYPRAMAGYQLFLKIANAKRYQLEISKVQLRLPSLRRQLEKHPGAKKK